MRVSTSQFYFQNTQQLTQQQSSVNDQVGYISSGKRVLTAKDDAVSYGTLAGYNNQLSNIEKYNRNITQAENRNSLQEGSFESAENLMQSLKTLFIQANNGTLSDTELTSLAELGEDTLNQMLDIANTKDETGGYVFSGFQTESQPFSMQPDNSVTYNGDNGTRELQIGQNVLVQTNQPGDEAFQKVVNHQGDFSAQYNTNTSGISLTSANITDRGAYDTTTNPPDYNFSFTSATDLTVTDSLGNTVYATTSYAAGQSVAFNGIEIQLDGNPLPGDDFDITPEEEISVFDTIKSAIDWMKAGTSSNGVEHTIEYGDILEQLDSALSHVVSNRTDAGVRLKLIQTQESNLSDTELYLASGKSNIEDLDFAKAVSEFEQSSVALQAAQQTFIQIKDLSLFNYI